MRRSELANAPLLGAWVVAGLGPTVSLLAYGRPFWPHALGVAAITALCVLTLSVTTTRPWPWLGLLAAAATAGTTSFLLGGRLVGLWTGLAVIAAGWGVLGQPPLPRLRPPDRSVRITLVALAVLSAAIYHRTNVAPRYALLLTAAGFAAITVSTIDHPAVRTPRRWITRGAHALGTAINAVLMTLLWVPAVLLPGAIQRLLRWDPTGIAGRPTPRWIARTPLRDNELRPWLAEPTATRPTPTQRLHGTLTSITTAATLTALALLAYGALPTTQLLPDPDNSTPPDITAANDVEAATRAEPWFDEMTAESAEVLADSYLSQWAGTELRDRNGTHVNIRAGRRLTWTPPPDRCDELVTVWMFGGSTLWGIGNRDNHTVPSAFARAAYLDGVGLEVHNWGAPEDVAWTQARRLERALYAEDPPDMVVFYDGGQDVTTVAGVNGTDRLWRGDVVGPLDSQLLRLLPNLFQDDNGGYTATPRADRSPRLLDPQTVAERAVHQYLLGDDLARSLLEPRGIPFVHVNQPTLSHRDPPVSGEPTAGPWSEIHHQFGEQLPDRIIDLTDAFRDVGEPHFVDDTHVDEAGNIVLGLMLWTNLKADLAPIAQTQGATCR